MLSMANSGHRDTNDSNFFFTLFDLDLDFDSTGCLDREMR